MLHRIPPGPRAPILGFGLGAVAGGFEVVALAATSKLYLDLPAALLLGAATVLLSGLVGALLSVPVGLALLAVRPAVPEAARYAGGMAATAGLLGWWFLVPVALVKLDQGLIPAALAFLATPIGVVGVTWFNAHYWFRREELGERRRFGWWAVSLVLGLLCASVGAVGLSQRSYGSSRALEGDPAILLVTVDGLRADVLGPDSPWPVPALESLAAAGVTYGNAIAPSADSRGAHAALMTGRHPVRVDVLTPSDRLARGYQTLAEVLDGEGYATGAFVSTESLVAESGLSQGFEVYDDDLLDRLPGLSQTRPVVVAQALWRWLRPGSPPPRRPDVHTVARAGEWMASVGDHPFLAWVQLAGPAPALAAGDRAAYGAALSQLNEDLDQLLVFARSAVGDSPLEIVVLGSHGGLLGEHGGVGPTGLWDETLRVPLIVVPHTLAARTRSVPYQVRPMDVPATLLDLLKLDPMEHAEGVDLIAFAEGFRDRNFSSLLVQAGPPLLLGYRAAKADNTGNIKFILDPVTGSAALYDLLTDPQEQSDIAASQPQAVEALRQQIRQETGALSR